MAQQQSSPRSDLEDGRRPAAKSPPGAAAAAALPPLCFLMGALCTLAIVSFGGQMLQGEVREAATSCSTRSMLS